MSDPTSTTAPDEREALRQSLAAALRDHWWSATDDETCSCGWVAPMWDEASTGSDDEAERAAIDTAHTAFLEHQAAEVAAVLAALPSGDSPSDEGWRASGVLRRTFACTAHTPPCVYDYDGRLIYSSPQAGNADERQRIPLHGDPDLRVRGNTGPAASRDTGSAAQDAASGDSPQAGNAARSFCRDCGLRLNDDGDHICAPWCEPCQTRHPVGYYGGVR